MTIWATSPVTEGLMRASPKAMAFFITVSLGPSIMPSTVGAFKKYLLSEWTNEWMNTLVWHPIEMPLLDGNSIGNIHLTSIKCSNIVWELFLFTHTHTKTCALIECDTPHSQKHGLGSLCGLSPTVTHPIPPPASPQGLPACEQDVPCTASETNPGGQGGNGHQQQVQRQGMGRERSSGPPRGPAGACRPETIKLIFYEERELYLRYETKELGQTRGWESPVPAFNTIFWGHI